MNPSMTLSPSVKLFGTDGIRGRANVFPMSAGMVLKIGQAIGLYFKERYSTPRIVIGKDTRRSGYMLEQALSSGICSVGVNTYFLGPLPTPGIAYITTGMRVNAGIVISASHNPYYDNGIKIFSSDGYKLPDEVEAKLESLAFSDLDSIVHTHTQIIGTSKRIEDAAGQYAVFLKEQFPKHLSLEGLRIVLDCANGAAYKVGPKVFEELGATVHLINARPNGVNINEQAGALHPEKLAAQVLINKANIGIAFDGDADRVVVVDERGEILDGDELLAICGTSMLEKDKLRGKTVVSTVMSNMGLERALQKAGGNVLRTNVGDRYVVEAMRKGNYNLGGEQSGHLIFRDSSTTGDGILAALAVLTVLLEKGQPISELKQCMQRMPQVLKNVVVPCKVPIAELPELQNYIQKMEERLGQAGRILFRYSGTELKVRVMIEGEDEGLIAMMVDDLSAKAATLITRYCK